MREARLWAWIRWRLDPGVDAVRVENPIGPGTPDVNFSVESVEGWMELKYRPREPTRPGAKLWPKKKGLSPQQIKWIQRRVGCGGNVWIVAGIAHYIFFVAGRQAKNFNAFSLEELYRFSDSVIDRRDPNAARLLNKTLVSPAGSFRFPRPAYLPTRPRSRTRRTAKPLPVLRRSALG